MRRSRCSPDITLVCRWNETARELVAATRTSPPMASRIYAYLSVAQDEAMVNAPDELGAVSAVILATLLPGSIETEGSLSCAAARIIDNLVERAASDGATAVWHGTIPVGPGLWSGTKPLLPLWGEVRPWCLERGDQFRAEPPPAFDSCEFRAALAEVRRISDHRSERQIEIARFWADGAGTSTPTGHWNQIACDLLLRSTPSARLATRVLRCMNVAMMDAGICCWDNKYAYWLIRPSQVDPAITTPVGLPNFPSFTSGHASFSGAAARVLGELLPWSEATVEAMADEAAVSRLYGGIHYRFDSDVGLDGGRRVADVALACCDEHGRGA